MTKYKLISLIILVFSISACNTDIPKEYGKTKAVLNGTDWKATVVYHGKISTNSDSIKIFMRQFSEEGYERKSLNFYFIPEQIGEIPLIRYEGNIVNGYFKVCRRPSTRILTSLDHGDVAGYSYSLIDNHPMNYFEITDIKRNGNIKGKFELAFIKDSIGSSNGPITPLEFPDTLFFEDGEFKSEIVE